jgi:hypothetical protein
MPRRRPQRRGVRGRPRAVHRGVRSALRLLLQGRRASPACWVRSAAKTVRRKCSSVRSAAGGACSGTALWPPGACEAGHAVATGACRSLLCSVHRGQAVATTLWPREACRSILCAAVAPRDERLTPQQRAKGTCCGHGGRAAHSSAQLTPLCSLQRGCAVATGGVLLTPLCCCGNEGRAVATGGACCSLLCGAHSPVQLTRLCSLQRGRALATGGAPLTPLCRGDAHSSESSPSWRASSICMRST